jgi:phage/plasmid-like protein (TIGR03299 family)
MAANVETMAYVKFEERDTPWHGLGTPVDHAMNSKEALQLSGQGWKVSPEPLFLNINGKSIKVDNTFANVRSSDNSVLGVVTGKYKIVQNEEAFSFTDALLGDNVKYETAGVLNNGKRVWILAKMPESEILGDKVENYLVFTNSHDGKGSIRVACTTVRVVCQNTLALSLKGAKRAWSTKHMGNMASKMVEAHRTLDLATKFQSALKAEAEMLAGKPFSVKNFSKFVENLLPMPKEATARQESNILLLRDDLNTRYMEAPDLGNNRNNMWGVINAVSDFATHRTPQRSSETYKEKVFASVIDANKIIDRAYSLLTV